MKSAPQPLPNALKWPCLILGLLLILGSLYGGYRAGMALYASIQVFLGPKGHTIPQKQWMTTFGGETGELVGVIVALLLGIWLLRKGLKSNSPADSLAVTSVTPEPVGSTAENLPQTALQPLSAVKLSGRVKHWNFCNVLHIAPDAKRLWQFEARGKNIVLGREQRVPHAEGLPSNWVSKSWSTLWQPKLNIAWLPSESVFLRVAELPAATPEETFSMVELQLEKLSPIPVTQMVWSMHVLGTHQSPPKPDGTVESLQTIIVVIASRVTVEEFMGRLERDGFLADRLEAPMLDQLEAVVPKGDSAWLFPMTIGGQNAALLAWWFGGTWRNISFVTLHPSGDRAAELKTQIGLLAMAGEVEGWLTGQPEWHLVADPVNAKEWEHLLREGLNEPVQVSPPPSSAELAGRSALRVAASPTKVHLQPPEFAERYRQQFFDRLWLHGLAYVGVLYAVCVVVYFCGAGWAGYQARGVESQLAGLGGSYTNAIQLKARLGVLQERAQLKYAALDSWEFVAENLPASVTLQRSGFSEGSKLTLSGQVDAADTQKLSDFYEALRKATQRDKDNKPQPFFNSQPSEQLSFRSAGNNVMSWNFSLELAHVETQP